jgi:hypothetical protein
VRDILAVRAEAFHEYTYPRPIVDMPPETENTAFNRAARVYETEIKKLQAELAAARQRVADADSFLNHLGPQ